MQINVAQLLKEATGATRSYEIDDTFNLEKEVAGPVQGEAKLIRTGKGILVNGAFRGKTSLICSRCLISFDYPLAFNIEEEFLPSTDVTSGSPPSLPEDLTTFTIDEHHVLDLSEAMRQYALLTIPMKPLCHPNCAGLCPQCGANLNQGACRCMPISLKLPGNKVGKTNLRRE